MCIIDRVEADLSGSHEGASNIVVLNAGAAIYVSGQALTLEAGIEMAKDAISSGLATEKMKEFVDFTKQIASSEADG